MAKASVHRSSEKIPDMETAVGAKPDLRYLIDSYLVWAARQDIPIVEGVAVDLHHVETTSWPRVGVGCRGAFVHLRGRGDFVALQVIDIPPDRSTDRLRHLFDEVWYVLAGHGRVVIEGDKTYEFDCGARALFSPPLNAPYRLTNTSASERMRLVCASNLPFLMNVFRNESFLFDNPMAFPQRVARDGYFSGERDVLPADHGRQFWDTSVIPDLVALPLPEWRARGGGSRNVEIGLSGSSMHVHLSQIPAGTYNKGRVAAGPHVFPLAGSGYTLVWKDGDAEFERHDWRPGLVFVAPDDRYHQHFNTGTQPSRHFAVSFGNHRYPVLARLAKRAEAPVTAVKDGGPQVDFEDQDPRIHALWSSELAKNGTASRMETWLGEGKSTR